MIGGRKINTNLIGSDSIRIKPLSKKYDCATKKVYYFTFLDPCINDYTLANENFLELTNSQDYFFLTSGEIDGVRYDEYLKSKNIRGTYIHCDSNSYVIKFNKFKKYLEENRETYVDTIFCKIDTDVVHYKTKTFHDFLNFIFWKNKNLIVGNEIMGYKGPYIRGGLNAVYVDSILRCPNLDETFKANSFDDIYTWTLESIGIERRYIYLFALDREIDLKVFATHTTSKGTKMSKVEEVIDLNKKLKLMFNTLNI